MNVQDTLAQRHDTHGEFVDNAEASQTLKKVIRDHIKVLISYAQMEALDAICGKIARIITGDPNHTDSWHDIAGYATLIERELNKPVKEINNDNI